MMMLMMNVHLSTHWKQGHGNNKTCYYTISQRRSHVATESAQSPYTSGEGSKCHAGCPFTLEENNTPFVQYEYFSWFELLLRALYVRPAIESCRIITNKIHRELFKTVDFVLQQ